MIFKKGERVQQKLFEKAYFIFNLTGTAWFGRPVLKNGKRPKLQWAKSSP